MKATPNLSVERYRVRTGPMGTGRWAGNNGAFVMGPLTVVASDGDGWDHVSVSRVDRCPTWEEMCDVKELFFESEEAVVQFHPPRSTYRNCHPFCLHLWRPQLQPIPLPDPEMVAPKGVQLHG